MTEKSVIGPRRVQDLYRAGAERVKIVLTIVLTIEPKIMLTIVLTIDPKIVLTMVLAI